MKNRKFIRGIKGESIRGTKTAFRSFRKTMQEFYDSKEEYPKFIVSYAFAWNNWFGEKRYSPY